MTQYPSTAPNADMGMNIHDIREDKTDWRIWSEKLVEKYARLGRPCEIKAIEGRPTDDIDALSKYDCVVVENGKFDFYEKAKFTFFILFCDVPRPRYSEMDSSSNAPVDHSFWGAIFRSKNIALLASILDSNFIAPSDEDGETVVDGEMFAKSYEDSPKIPAERGSFGSLEYKVEMLLAMASEKSTKPEPRQLGHILDGEPHNG